MKVKNVLRAVARFTRAKEGVSAMEYAIVVGIVVAGVGGAVWAFTDDVETAVGTIGDKVTAGANTMPAGSLAQPTTP
ncbi:MAG: hypothetical protein OXI20_18690 [Rhodospirillales bacterium]|nr:hypothetical protein [Rhodospirillales bacterium]